MNRRRRPARFATVLLVWLAPVSAGAQAAAQPAPTAAATSDVPSKLWIVGGGTWTTLRGDCQTCDHESPYRHAGSVLANIGYRVNRRMDVGAEVFWVPATTAAGDHIRTTHLDAIAQFRFWESKGFFVKGGAGMAFVRNWLYQSDAPPITSKALSVVIGAGWAFRPAERVGLQVFGTQHVAALGDLKTSESDVQDVVGNFWSLGAAVVIR